MKKFKNFYLKTFRFLVVKFSIYLNRHVLVMFRLPLDSECYDQNGHM